MKIITTTKPGNSSVQPGILSFQRGVFFPCGVSFCCSVSCTGDGLRARHVGMSRKNVGSGEENCENDDDDNGNYNSNWDTVCTCQQNPIQIFILTYRDKIRTSHQVKVKTKKNQKHSKKILKKQDTLQYVHVLTGVRIRTYGPSTAA